MKGSTSSRLTIKKGDIITGTVNNIKPYGVFIKLNNGLTGLLHKEDIANVPIDNPGERYNIGDEVQLTVKNYNPDTGKLALSNKAMQDKWEESVNSLCENAIVEGIARNKYKNGIFIELKPNVVGLADYNGKVSYGDKVNVTIKKIIPETKKIKLEFLD